MTLASHVFDNAVGPLRMYLARFVSLGLLASLDSLAFFATFVLPAFDKGLGTRAFKLAPFVPHHLSASALG